MGRDLRTMTRTLTRCVLLFVQLYPDFTPFKGLVSGFGAISRHFPSGSPAVVYCLSRLAERTGELYKTDKHLKTQDFAPPTKSGVNGSDQSRSLSIDDMGTAEKLQVLLLHLILVVDLQVRHVGTAMREYTLDADFTT